MKLILVLLPFLIAGCLGCDPDCECPEQTTDDYVWSLTPANDGVLLVGSRFTHDVGDEIGPLDCSCPGNYESPFLIEISPDGQNTPVRGGYFNEHVLAAGYHGDDVVQAGFTWRACENREGDEVPVIFVVDENGLFTRYAVVECEFFEVDYDWSDFPQRRFSRVAVTQDGGAIFWGLRSSGSYGIIRVSTYGENLWERDVSFSPASATMNVLLSGEIIVVEWSGTVRLLSSDGVQVWERRVGNGSAQPHSGMQLSGTGFSISGSVTSGTESNPMVWHFDPAGAVLDSIEISYPGCQDSVQIVMSWLDEEILVCRHRENCGSDNKVLLMRLSQEGDTLSTFVWGATGNTVLRCVAVPENGDLYVAAMTNAPTGNAGDNYSVVLAKFSSMLHLLWTMRI